MIIKDALWKEQAKEVEEKLGIQMVGDTKTVECRVRFIVAPAGGYRRVDMEIEIPEDAHLSESTRQLKQDLGNITW